MIKCPLCQLNHLQKLEYKDFEALVEHCEEYHTMKTLAWSFVEGYFAHKELRDKIKENIDRIENTRKEQNGILYQFQVAPLVILQSLLE
jgi:hypothetical protein